MLKRIKIHPRKCLKVINPSLVIEASLSVIDLFPITNIHPSRKSEKMGRKNGWLKTNVTCQKYAPIY